MHLTRPAVALSAPVKQEEIGFLGAARRVRFLDPPASFTKKCKQIDGTQSTRFLEAKRVAPATHGEETGGEQDGSNVDLSPAFQPLIGTGC